jgi:hypothetical protein
VTQNLLLSPNRPTGELPAEGFSSLPLSAHLPHAQHWAIRLTKRASGNEKKKMRDITGWVERGAVLLPLNETGCIACANISASIAHPSPQVYTHTQTTQLTRLLFPSKTPSRRLTFDHLFLIYHPFYRLATTGSHSTCHPEAVRRP